MYTNRSTDIIKHNLLKQKRKLELIKQYIDKGWDKLREQEKQYKVKKQRLEQDIEDFEQQKNEWLIEHDLYPKQIEQTQPLNWEMELWIEHYEESSSLGE